MEANANRPKRAQRKACRAFTPIINRWDLAHLCKEIGERMTGDKFDVVPRNWYFVLMRKDGYEWIRT